MKKRSLVNLVMFIIFLAIVAGSVIAISLFLHEQNKGPIERAEDATRALDKVTKENQGIR
jgi:hypothetical protein